MISCKMNNIEVLLWLILLSLTWPWDNWTVIPVMIAIGIYAGITEANAIMREEND